MHQVQDQVAEEPQLVFQDPQSLMEVEAEVEKMRIPPMAVLQEQVAVVVEDEVVVRIQLPHGLRQQQRVLIVVVEAVEKAVAPILEVLGVQEW